MAIESERKFLLKNDTWRTLSQRQIHIEQGYFPKGDGFTVRVRIIDDAAAKLTIKSPKFATGISRYEFEYDIPLEDARVMLDVFCQKRRIEKIRHLVDYEGHRWEIDEFLGCHQGLVVAEIELQSLDEAYAVPEWLGEDVTELKKYGNQFLANIAAMGVKL